jgi:uncharacterized RDD family membrane protein YckC/uncharacterized protein YbaR (Trm112 family)
MEYQEYLDNYVAYEPVLSRRCWAAAIDYVVYSALVVICVYFFGDVKKWGFDDGEFDFNVTGSFIVTSFIWFMYFPVMESVFGYTLGKGLFDLKVVQENKRDFPIAVYFKRHCLDFIDFFCFGLIAVLCVKFTREHKRLGDFFAHSRVILDKAEPSFSFEAPAVRRRPRQSYFDFCPACKHFIKGEGVCGKHWFRVAEYPEKFQRECEGTDYQHIELLPREFTCPACKSVLELEDNERESLQVSCPDCGHSYRFPERNAA